MSKVKFVDAGAGAEQINLGTLPDSQENYRVALTREEQTFGGEKFFKDIVESPSSEPDIFSAVSEDLVTYEQLATYRDRINNQVIESGAQFAIGDANMTIDDAGGTVTFNPPVVESPTTGKIVYRGSTSRGRTFIHAFFPELVLKLPQEDVTFLEPTLLRIYTSAEPPVAQPPSGGGGGGGGGGGDANSATPKECPIVQVRVPREGGAKSFPGKVVGIVHDGDHVVVSYRPNEC